MQSFALQIKVVIYDKCKNLHKTIKKERISLKVIRLLIFVVLYSLEYKIDIHAA